MTKEEMIELAKQAGFVTNEIKSYVISPYTSEDQDLYQELEAFAKLVAEKAIKEALAQPKQEPLAWISTGPASMIHWTADKPAYGDDWVPLYTNPPQREFVGLTDEEIDQGLLRSNHALQTAGAWRDGVEWATKQLKEKNT